MASSSVATTDIKRGQHVHTHNCASLDDLKDSVVTDTDSVSSKTSSSAEGTRTFMGYRRPDGRVGIRQPRPDPSHEHLCLRHHGE